MALLVPKIVYNSITLNFTYPPVQKPGDDEYVAKRTDTDSSSGKRQSICERIDVYKTLQMDFVPMTDLANWNAFFQWALLGKSFDYYPDSTLGTYTTYTLDDTDWTPAFAFRKYAKFKLKLRQLV